MLKKKYCNSKDIFRPCRLSRGACKQVVKCDRRRGRWGICTAELWGDQGCTVITSNAAERKLKFPRSFELAASQPNEGGSSAGTPQILRHGSRIDLGALCDARLLRDATYPGD